MPRCPNCNSNSVYRHTGFRQGGRYLCRTCMCDLVETGRGLFSPRALAIVACVTLQVLVVLAFHWPAILTLVAGVVSLVPAFWVADHFVADLEMLPRESERLREGDPQFARAAWFGLRRR